MLQSSVPTNEPSLRSLTADEIQLTSGGNPLAVGAFVIVVAGVTLYLGYKTYKAAEDLANQANSQNGNSEGR
ncbi:MAG: hypothetical protein AB1749_12755 [Pseudomonadota bacterium]